MNFKKTVFLVAISGFLFASCESDNKPDEPKGDYENGILITNEGAFSGGTGTINFISDDYVTEESEVYNKVNNENIGTILQSIGFNDDDAYLIANVGNKISVVDRYTMKKITEITTDLSNPRYIAFANGKGYVTNWGDSSDLTDDYIAVVDLATNMVTSTISVSDGPEQIIANGNTLYVSHKWSSVNYITVINTSNNTVIKTINVGKTPDEMAIDNNGDLLVSCEGNAWSSPEVLGSLIKVNTTTNEVNSIIDFAASFHPEVMVFNEGNIYFAVSSKIYKISEDDSTMPTTEIITATPIYGMSVNDGKIYVTDAKDYASNGTLKIFDATTNTELKEFTVGLNPGKIYFN